MQIRANIRICPMLLRWAWLVHPLTLHCLYFCSAPCFTHTPPVTTTFVHPSLLHRLTFAPCLTHTPPLTAILVHPSLLHSLIFAPCLLHTPPFSALFVHPSLLHRLLDAHSSFLSLICASFTAASFDLCPMRYAHSPFDDYIGAFFIAA
jgi:hypothetical protein